MEKRLVIWAVVCLFFVQQVVAQDVPGGINTENLRNDSVVQGVERLQEEVANLTGDEGRNFLRERWKETLLENKVVFYLDAFLQKISFVFFVFLGEPYSFSLSLLFILFLWTLHFIIFNKITNVYSPMSKGTNLLISLGLAVVFSHVNYFVFLSDIASSAVSAFSGVWRYAGWVFVLIVIMVLFKIAQAIGKKLEKTREESTKAIVKQDQDTVHKVAEGVRKGLDSDFVDDFESELKDLENAVTFESARKIFSRLANKHHPDKGGSNEKMKKINRSWGSIKKKFGK